MKNFGNKIKYPSFVTCKDLAQRWRYDNIVLREKLKTTPHLKFVTQEGWHWDDSYIKGLEKDCRDYNIEFEIEKVGRLDYGVFINRSYLESPFLMSSNINKFTGIWMPPDFTKEEEERLAWTDIDRVLSDSVYDMPCTPQVVWTYLNIIGYDLDGKRVCIVGRGNVGEPLSRSLIKHSDATVTVCNSRTRDIYDIFKESDLIITATDVVNMFNMKGIHVPILDVGLGVGKDGKLHGNVIEDTIEDDVDFCATGINTFGLLTREELIERVLEFYEDFD